MQENQNQSENEQPSKPPTVGQDLQEEAFVDETSKKDEEAVVAGVEAVGRVSIFIAHITRFIKMVWQTPKYRYSSLAGLVILIGLLSWWPTSRYGTLNLVGVRGTVQLSVLDTQTNRPISRVDVTIGDSTGETDDEGIVRLENIRLGTNVITINKSAYADEVIEAQIGLGTNVLEEVSLNPIGTSFTFNVTDWLSDEPLENARVSYQDNEAIADADGVALLIVPPLDEEQIEVTISAENYHMLTAELNTTLDAPTSVELTSAPNNYFISRRNGQYDIYSTRLDGSEQKLVIPGTGSESDDIRFSVDPNNKYGMLVSTRNGIRDANGRLQKSLHVVDLEGPGIDQVDQSQDIQLIGWIDSALIYVRIGEGESTFSPRRHQIMSYNVQSRQTNELEASNHFNDVKIIQDKIYYAADDSFKQESPKPYLYVMNPDGSNKTPVIERQSWTIFQSGYDSIIVNATKSQWFDYTIGASSAQELTGQPSKLEDRRYVDNNSGKKSAWIDERDGKGVLLVYNTETKQEDVVHQVGGLQSPIRWINDDKIIFRVANSQETADYIVDIDGGEPQKITDTSNISSDTRWFYY